MSSTFRADGLDNPLSPNGSRVTWGEVSLRYARSAAVKRHSESGGGISVVWCDGTEDAFAEPGDAIEALRAMEAT